MKAFFTLLERTTMTDLYDHEENQAAIEAAGTKTKKPRAITATAAAAETATAGHTEQLVLAAANANKALTTPKGTSLRLDLLGISMESHAETSASTSEPCPRCKHSRNIKLQATNELKPDSHIGWHDRSYPGEYTYSPTGLSMTPRVERVKSYKITGYSRKFVQSCTCGAPMGCTWNYDPACHGLSLVEVYHRF